jgi:hypothetical protein
LGDQVYVDEDGNILGTVDRYLGNSADIGLDELGERILSRGGMFIPSHIDRPFFSVVSQLGFLPDLPYTAVELVDPSNRHLAVTGGRIITGIYTSDAHYPDDIGRRSTVLEIDGGRPAADGTAAGFTSGGTPPVPPDFAGIRSAVEAGKTVYHRS